MSASLRGVHLGLHNLSKRFGDQSVLRHVDLVVRPGEFIAIVGKSGCGKSTLLRLIAGLNSPTEGRIDLNGERIQGIHPYTRMMFQDARLLPWKRVLQNVGLGLQGDWRTRASVALAQVGLLNRADEWPGVLSGGQRQRVALARALVSQPRLLLLDEPLGALDALTRIEMQQLIEKLWSEQQFTALLVTHDVTEAVTLADRVVLLEEGQVVMDLRIDLPRPRHQSDRAFVTLREELLDRVLGRPQADPSPFPELAMRETALNAPIF